MSLLQMAYYATALWRVILNVRLYELVIDFKSNKKLYQSFSRQVNQLILNIPVLKGLLKVNSKAEKHLQSWQIEKNESQILKYQIKEIKRVVN